VRVIDVEQENLREALKRVAVALKETGLPFALAGGYAVWARGGPEPEHDVDFLVAEEDAPKAATLLAEHGFQVVQPPEDWLFKVFTDEVMVDVIYRDATIPAERAMIADADQIEVISVVMPVLSATRLMVQKLHAMDERYCDFGRLLPVARALREQVDWDQVRTETEDNDFAVNFLFLLERLNIV
jgi:Uncharacterised nucleotidyltransferase